MKKNKVLVVAVHPDDETLGCGGALLKHQLVGDEICWLIATELAQESGYSAEQIKVRQKEIESVANAYGFAKIFNLNLPTTKVDGISFNELIGKISHVFNEIKPNIIYLPFRGDVHSDHRIVFDAAYSCTKNFRYPFIKKILMMETLSETEFSPTINEAVFSPNAFVDISEYFKKKIEIMKIYKDQLAEHPFPRSLKNLEALATFRGATIGVQYAESFMILKEIS